jgi:FtsP/CotA-like multicopper oxidase with cupredoxin domain
MKQLRCYVLLTICFSFVVAKSVEHFTLVISDRLLPGSTKTEILVNGTSPGPPIRVTLGNDVEVTVINEVSNDVTVVHWHGMIQKGTPFSDGVMNITQCPITNIVGYNSMVYKFTPTTAGSFWYHGHYNEQYVWGTYCDKRRRRSVAC